MPKFLNLWRKQLIKLRLHARRIGLYRICVSGYQICYKKVPSCGWRRPADAGPCLAVEDEREISIKLLLDILLALLFTLCPRQGAVCGNGNIFYEELCQVLQKELLETLLTFVLNI